MSFIHRHGAKPALPEMAGALFSRMYMSGIQSMDTGQNSTQSIRVFWNQNQMNMIWHQDPTPYGDTTFSAGCRQQVAVEPIIGVTEECLRPTIASLSHMVRKTGNSQTCEASHTPMWQRAGVGSIMCTVTVILSP
jgi:hypothetical protein